jgi:3-oxoacyl-[acyl-carrier protein] reductase
LIALIRGLRQLLPSLAKAGADVVIHYHSSEKAALAVLSEVKSLGRKGKIVQGNIVTNVISRDLVLTDATKDQPAEVHEMLKILTPLQRLAIPEDVAGAILSLVAEWRLCI